MNVQQTQRGAQAVEILLIEPPEGTGQPPLTDIAEIEEQAYQPLEPARVKWCDKANVFGSSEDVFIHIEVPRLSGFADLQPGEAVLPGHRQWQASPSGDAGLLLGNGRAGTPGVRATFPAIILLIMAGKVFAACAPDAVALRADQGTAHFARWRSRAVRQSANMA